MKNKAFKKATSGQNPKFIKSIATAAGLAFAVYLLYSQLFIGFLQFGYKSIDTGDGASYVGILDVQKNKEETSSVFRINEDELLFTIKVTQKQPKYLLFNVNYMDSDATTVRILFKNNDVEVAQDEYTFSQGSSYYKIPKVGIFDELELLVTNKNTITLGINGISTLSTVGMDKQGVLLSLVCFIIVLMGRKILKLRTVKYMGKNVISTFEEFLNFIRVIKIEFATLVCIAILGYGFFCTNFTLSLDEELFWMIKDGSPWVGYGRFGNYFLDKYLTFDSSVMPFVTDILAVSILFISSLLYAFSFYKENKSTEKRNFQYTIFGGLFLTFPFVNGDFMAISVYNLWVSIGYLLTALAVIISRGLKATNRKNEIVLAAIFLTSAISIYQSFISVFIVMFLLLEFQKNLSTTRRILIKDWINAVLIVAMATGIYLILNSLAQKLIIPAYGYLNMLIGWDKGLGVVEILLKTTQGIKDIYLGTYGSSGRILTISVAIFAIFVTTELFLLSTVRRKTIALCISILMFIGPFITVLALGNMLPARSLIGLPLLLGGIWLVLLTNLNSRTLKKVLTLMGAVLLFFQIQFLNALFYGDFLRYQGDVFMGRQIIQQIESQGINYRKYPIVFLGSHKLDSTKLISNINSGGRSFFDDSSQAYRMTYFLRTLGFQVLIPSESDSKKAFNLQPKEIWPQSGSIALEQNIIIIKLSE